MSYEWRTMFVSKGTDADGKPLIAFRPSPSVHHKDTRPLCEVSASTLMAAIQFTLDQASEDMPRVEVTLQPNPKYSVRIYRWWEGPPRFFVDEEDTNVIYRTPYDLPDEQVMEFIGVELDSIESYC